MTIKRTVREFCPKCGERIAELRGNRIYESGHNNCPALPRGNLGPPNPPRAYMVGDVIWEPNREG